MPSALIAFIIKYKKIICTRKITINIYLNMINLIPIEIYDKIFIKEQNVYYMINYLIYWQLQLISNCDKIVEMVLDEDHGRFELSYVTELNYKIIGITINFNSTYDIGKYKNVVAEYYFEITKYVISSLLFYLEHIEKLNISAYGMDYSLYFIVDSIKHINIRHDVADEIMRIIYTLPYEILKKIEKLTIDNDEKDIMKLYKHSEQQKKFIDIYNYIYDVNPTLGHQIIKINDY